MSARSFVQYLRAEAHEVVVLQFVAAARRPPLAAAPLVCAGATSRAVFGREEVEVAPHVGAVALQMELTLAGPALQTDMQTYIMTVRASRIMVWARVKYIMVQSNLQDGSLVDALVSVKC